jgi:hypothetical protein
VTTLKIRVRHSVNVNKASDLVETFARSRNQLEHEGRGVPDRAGNVRKNHQIDMTLTPRPETQVGERTAMLNRGANRPPEVNTTNFREP